MNYARSKLWDLNTFNLLNPTLWTLLTVFINKEHLSEAGGTASLLLLANYSYFLLGSLCFFALHVAHYFSSQYFILTYLIHIFFRPRVFPSSTGSVGGPRHSLDSLSAGVL